MRIELLYLHELANMDILDILSKHRTNVYNILFLLKILCNILHRDIAYKRYVIFVIDNYVYTTCNTYINN